MTGVCGACGGLGQTDRGFACPACMCVACEVRLAVTDGLCRRCHVLQSTPAPCECCGGSGWTWMGMLPGGLPVEQECTRCATAVAQLARELGWRDG